MTNPRRRFHTASCPQYWSHVAAILTIATTVLVKATQFLDIPVSDNDCRPAIDILVSYTVATTGYVKQYVILVQYG